MSITVVIPAYNEEHSILRCLECIKNQNIALKKISISLVIAKSKDNTFGISKEWKEKNFHLFNDIKIINNRKGSLAAAWNLGIKNCLTDYVILSSGHFFMDKNYINILLRALRDNQEIDTIGGNIISDSSKADKSYFDKLINKLFSTRALVGNASYRTLKLEKTLIDKNCDTAVFGCYKMSNLKKIGLFDESLLRSQDFEFHCRLRRKGLIQARHTKAFGEYKLRCDLFSSLKYSYINGYWIGRPIVKYPYMFRIRHGVPALFWVTIYFLSILAIFKNGILTLLPIIFVLLLYVGFIIIGMRKVNLSFLDKIIGLIYISIYHFLYGNSYIHGFLNGLNPLIRL